MAALGWLTAHPIAHRGLHDAACGVIENTASAFEAAIAGGFAIECDLQIAADGEAMVHHDARLGRLTLGEGLLAEMSVAALRRVAFRHTADRMMTLGELCDLVGGRATLVLELKSAFNGERRLVERVAAVLAGYRGPAAAMSFDPQMVAMLRQAAPALARGIVAESWTLHGVRQQSHAAQGQGMAYLRHLAKARPQFLAYNVKDLPSAAVLIARSLLQRPVLAWTVREANERERAARYASQMIFEGFRP